MNPQRLVKHFPELANFPTPEQHRLLEQAYKDAFNPNDKMKNWRSNLIHALVMTTICFSLVWALPRFAPVSPQTTAWILMLLVLPCFFVVQQRRFIRQLRLSLKKFLPS